MNLDLKYETTHLSLISTLGYLTVFLSISNIFTAREYEAVYTPTENKIATQEGR